MKLCQLLRVRFYKYPRLEIQIFASEEAAKKFIDLYEFGEYEKYYPALRGHYWLDRSTGEEYLEYSEGPKPSQKTNETSPHSTSATARAVDQN